MSDWYWESKYRTTGHPSELEDGDGCSETLARARGNFIMHILSQCPAPLTPRTPFSITSVRPEPSEELE
jgi:hypothetical protein